MLCLHAAHHFLHLALQSSDGFCVVALHGSEGEFEDTNACFELFNLLFIFRIRWNAASI
jgi:hypothetical protein